MMKKTQGLRLQTGITQEALGPSKRQATESLEGGGVEGKARVLGRAV